VAWLQSALGDRYVLEHEVGAGGMARVFAARDLKHGRRVAIKVLRPESAAWMGDDRFHREIELAARLQHPHILPIYDSGGEGSHLYYVMPFVTGETLRERLERDGRLPVDEAVRLACEVADGLDYAHHQNVVHRDIKPGNILLSGVATGRIHAMVADFGIARAIQEAGDLKLTQTGSSLGTPAYMSPEQSFGERTIDGRSDQYSLACVLYEMLIGEIPFSGPTAMAVLGRKSTEPARSATALRQDVPRSVDRAMLRALDRDPEHRFPTMAEFAAALRASDSPADTRIGTIAPAAWSIAVLPFANMSPGEENEYLSDGITDDLIHALAKLDGLRVLARTSTFALKARHQDVRTIGRELQVTAVLEGSVRRSGDRLRVTTQLVDASNGFELWSERYDRKLDDVFDVQDEISRSIVEALRVGVLRKEQRLVTAPTESISAYECFLKGRFHWNQRTESGLFRSQQFLEAAIAADPNFLEAFAGLADVHLTLGIYGALPPDETMPRALKAAEQVLARDTRSSEALAARGSVRALYQYDWTGAEQDFVAATQAGPQYPTAHQWYAMHCLAPLRRFGEGRARLGRARELDPLSPAVAVSLGVLEYYEGDDEKAAASFASVLERDPSFGLAAYFLGQVDTRRQQFAPAIASLERAKVLTGDSPEVESALGVAHALAGDSSAATRSLDRLVERARTRYISPVLLAQIHVALKNEDRALGYLQLGYQSRATEMALLDVRPVFDPLRLRPEFRDLVRRIRG
jgi:eukaryotic-like serine/threonine-protein kinase